MRSCSALRSFGHWPRAPRGSAFLGIPSPLPFALTAVAGLGSEKSGELVSTGSLVRERQQNKIPLSGVLARPPASARQEVNQGKESDDDRRGNGDDRDGGDG